MEMEVYIVKSVYSSHPYEFDMLCHGHPVTGSARCQPSSDWHQGKCRLVFGA